MDNTLRKSPRIPKFDYSSPNYYFVTICTQKNKILFGEPNRLNPFGQIALQDLLDIPSHFPDVSLDAYVVMPNHIHAIIVLNPPSENRKPASLNTVIGQYKSGVSRKIRSIRPETEVWQRSYFDTVLRNEAAYLEALTYIQNNPFKWDLTKNKHDI